MPVRIELPLGCIRSWRLEDADSLVKHGNDREIWLNLRDRFPHPYTPQDAARFLHHVTERDPETLFAIDVGGRAVGGIGFHLHSDVERISAEVGYWLGREFWNRGIATEAIKAISGYAIREYGLKRLYAIPFEWNEASCRVLEKAGYVREARMRNAALKDGKVIDQFLYALVVDER